MTSCLNSLAFLAALLNLVVTTNADTPRHGWVVHNQGHYYFFAEDALNWTDARNVCEEQGGHLVEIGSATEQTYLDSIITQLQGTADYYIGLNDRHQEGQFVWENTGRPGYYWNWHTNQPDNADVSGAENCVHNVDSKWNDLACYKTRRYICEL